MCSNIPDSGGAFKVTVYSPYVLLNRTGLELDVRSKAFLGGTKAAAGQGVFANSENEARKPKPFMFAFGTDDQKNRALIKVGDSQWSKPQSFDAIGSTYSVTLASSSGRQEMDVGVKVEEGEGKVSSSTSFPNSKTKLHLVQLDQSRHHCTSVHC
jgi:vacuolar protein sorting-associated protein 13A/C